MFHFEYDKNVEFPFQEKLDVSMLESAFETTTLSRFFFEEVDILRKVDQSQIEVPKVESEVIRGKFDLAAQVGQKQQYVLSEHAFVKHNLKKTDDEYRVKTINCDFSYERVDKITLSVLFHSLGIRNDHFNGAMGRALNTSIKNHVCDNYLLSVKRDGIRAWLFVYKNKVYMQLRDNRFYFISDTDFGSDVICDIEVMIENDNIEFMLYDCIYYNKNITSMHFMGRYEKLLQVNLIIPKIRCTFQSYFSIDMLTPGYIEGIVFTKIDSPYIFGMSDNLFFWKSAKTTVDLRYCDGNLYSALYKKDRSFDKFVKEGHVHWTNVNGMVVEVYQGPSGFVYVRDRYDKKMPNATSVVRDILSVTRNISYSALLIEAQMRKTFYSKDRVFSFYNIFPDISYVSVARFKKAVLYSNRNLTMVQKFMIDKFMRMKDELDRENASASVTYYLFYLKKHICIRFVSCAVHGMGKDCAYEYYDRLERIKPISRCVNNYRNESDMTKSVQDEIDSCYKFVDGKIVSLYDRDQEYDFILF